MELASSWSDPLIVAGALGTTMLVTWAAAWWLGGKSPVDVEEKSAGRFIDSSLGLLGLLLAFTFAMALGKYEQRRTMLVGDVNGIGDFYTCASLLPQPHRTALQQVTRDYVRVRLQWAQHEMSAAKAQEESLRLQGQMTDLCAAAMPAAGMLAIPLTNTLNALQSNHVSLRAALRDQIPSEVIGLLVTSAVVTTILVGRSHGARKKMPVTGTLFYVLLVSAAVLVVLDLNNPREGFITLEVEPLTKLAQTMAVH